MICCDTSIRKALRTKQNNLLNPYRFGGGVAPVYTTWNPADKYTGCTLSGANLLTTFTSQNGLVRSVASVSVGKWYWEVTLTAGAGGVGVIKGTESLTQFLGNAVTGYSYFNNGYKFNNGVFTLIETYAAVTTIGVMLDMNAGEISFRKNGVAVGGVAFSGLTGIFYATVGTNGTTYPSHTANFGASAFGSTPPAGYNAGLYT